MMFINLIYISDTSQSSFEDSMYDPETGLRVSVGNKSFIINIYIIHIYVMILTAFLLNIKSFIRNHCDILHWYDHYFMFVYCMVQLTWCI